MRKLLLCAAMIAGTVCVVNAQEKKISFGVRAGVNINTLSYSGPYSEDYDFKSRVGYHVGVLMDWNAAHNFYVQPAVYFTTRGAKTEWSDDEYNESEEHKFNMNYLQIPVVASYRFPVGENLKIDVNVGPYIAVGLGGKYKSEYSYDGKKVEEDSHEYNIFDKSSDKERGGDFKRFDAGLRFGAGVHIKRGFIGFSYDLGLNNLCRTGMNCQWEKKEKIKNGSFQISLGYNF